MVQEQLKRSPFITGDMRNSMVSKKTAQVKAASGQFNRRLGSNSFNTGPASYGSVATNPREGCDKLRKSDLAKITELEKQLEECHSGKNKPGFVQKIKEAGKSLKRSFKDSFGSQNGGKRKRTRRRKNRKKTKRKSKTRRNRKTRRHKR